MIIAGVILLIVGGGLWCYLSPKGGLAWNNPDTTTKKPGPEESTAMVAAAPAGISIAESRPAPPPEDPILNKPGSQMEGGTTPPAGPTSVDYQEQARVQMEMQRQQFQAQREQEATQQEQVRQARMQAIREAPSTIYSAAMDTPITQTAAQTASGSENREGGFQPVQNPNGAPNTLQGRLNTFNTSTYLPNTRQSALSPYEVKAGTVIPSVMLSGINSDLPGEIIAQVVQNVYDSATGRYCLIPQGAKLVGTYDHQVVTGQSRVLIAWSRIIYPDSSSVDIQGMAGQDQSGYAGFKDKTRNHVWTTFRNALLLSAITAGVQLSQPRAQKGDYSYSSQQMIAGSLGMQLNQLGLSSYQGRVNAAPTITIRPGYRFNVMVSKDMVLSPWQSEAATQPAFQTAWSVP